MGQYIDLLRSLPKPRRDVCARAADKSAQTRGIARLFGEEYFDGDRKYGYGGYRYDGRWIDVARDVMRHYFRDRMDMIGSQVNWPGVRVLDVGCAKGFLVHDLVDDCGVDAYGVDLSRYAIVEQPHPDAVGRLHVGTADCLPFPDKSFDLVLSINTLHNLPRDRLVRALREIKRVSRGGMFVQVDSYRTQAEKALFEDWVLTAAWHGYPEEWAALFAEAGYDGDYAWTIVEAE